MIIQVVVTMGLMELLLALIGVYDQSGDVWNYLGFSTKGRIQSAEKAVPTVSIN